MAFQLPRPAIAAPNFFVFIVAYAGWTIGLVMWLLRTQITGPHRSGQPELLYFALTPLVLLASSRWAGKSPSFLTLFLRSVLAHAISFILPGALMGIAHSSAPGASGHGGLFLVFLILIVYGGGVALVVGLVSSLSAFGAMRLLRKPEGHDGAPGGGAPRR
jgi:hypothetical protein